jgi:predicted ATP-dependent endonuclease of OLD family
MQLRRARVTNFKSIEDSGEFTIGPNTCLVGKNEAGKTAILEALYKLNPYGSDSTYDLQRNYPRRFLSEYKDRHRGRDAQVVETKWELTDDELADLHKLVGKNAATGREVTITKAYNQTNTYWTVPVDEQAALKHIVSSSQLHQEEKDACKQTSIKELKTFLAGVGAAASLRQTHLLGYLNEAFKRDAADLACIDVLEMPKFVYFSSYNRMHGQVALEEIIKKKAEKRLDEDDRVFLAFLDLVGTSLEEVANINRFEALVSKLEATSTRISREIFSYWSQNRHLKVQFRLDAAQAGDPPPFNSGRIMRTRILNLHHDVTVSFDERSTGFVWFFSFLVLFSQVKKTHGDYIILLLDEPGLSLHAKAQEDLLRYFREKLEPHHQLIYTTHSPFMIPADNLLSVRTVEDVVVEETGKLPDVLGTKVRDDVLATDRDTIFPLQSALGYEITQTLFVGKNTLLVEGPSDLIYLKVFSEELRNQNRAALDPQWIVCPTGGIDKVGAFMSLFNANKLNVAVLTDLAKGQKKKIEDLRRSTLLREGHVLSAEKYTSQEEADIEDIIGADNYAYLVNACYALSDTQKIQPNETGARIAKTVEDHFRTLAPEFPEYDHFKPSLFLIENKKAVIEKMPDLPNALDRFERLFNDLNALLETQRASVATLPKVQQSAKAAS